jgi:hypothetical protein
LGDALAVERQDRLTLHGSGLHGARIYGRFGETVRVGRRFGRRECIGVFFIAIRSAAILRREVEKSVAAARGENERDAKRE